MKLLFALASVAFATSNGKWAGDNALSEEAKLAKHARIEALRQDQCKDTQLSCPAGKASCFCRDAKKDETNVVPKGGKSQKCAVDHKKLAQESENKYKSQSGTGFCRDQMKRCRERDIKNEKCKGKRCLVAGKDKDSGRQKCISMPDKCQRIVNKRVCGHKHRREIVVPNTDDKVKICCKMCYRKKPKQQCIHDKLVEYKGVVAVQKQGSKGVATWDYDKSLIRSKTKMCCISGSHKKADFTKRSDGTATGTLDAHYLKVKGGNKGKMSAESISEQNKAWENAPGRV